MVRAVPRRAIWVFAKTYIAALLVLLAGFWLVRAFIPAFLGTSAYYSSPVPTPQEMAGFSLKYREGSERGWTTLSVGADEAECQALAHSAYLRDACVLAVNVDPHWIAPAARGRLNFEDTPAYVAIVWRSVLSGDRSTCDAGGLLAERRAACETAVASGSASFSDGPVTAAVSLLR